MSSTKDITFSFVQLYYQNLHENPAKLSHLYTEDAQLTHSKIPEDSGVNFISKNIEEHSLSSKKDIETFYSNSKLANSKIRVSSIDYQTAFESSIFISVLGELIVNDEVAVYRFTQSFILKATSAKTYDIANDIFRLIPDEDYELSNDYEEEKETSTEILSNGTEPKETVDVQDEKVVENEEVVAIEEENKEEDKKKKKKEEKEEKEAKKEAKPIKTKKDETAAEKTTPVVTDTPKKTTSPTPTSTEKDVVTEPSPAVIETPKQKTQEKEKEPKKSEKKEVTESTPEQKEPEKKETDKENEKEEEKENKPIKTEVPGSWAQAVSSNSGKTTTGLKPKVTKPAAPAKKQQTPSTAPPLSDVTNTQKQQQSQAQTQPQSQQGQKKKTGPQYSVHVLNVDDLNEDQIRVGFEKEFGRVIRAVPRGHWALVTFETADSMNKALAKKTITVNGSSLLIEVKSVLPFGDKNRSSGGNGGANKGQPKKDQQQKVTNRRKK